MRDLDLQRIRRGEPVDDRHDLPAVAPGRVSSTSLLSVPGVTRSSGLIRRDASGGAIAGHAAGAVDAASASTGQPLPAATRDKFEASLGTDLGAVRIHTGDAAGSAASALGARAYAIGQDIHFAAGQYAPGSRDGERLLAHEVAHTVQQAGHSPTVQHKLEVSSPGDACEVEADVAAEAMVQGAPAQVSAVGGGAARQIARKPDGGGAAAAGPTEKHVFEAPGLPMPSMPLGPYAKLKGSFKMSIEADEQTSGGGASGTEDKAGVKNHGGERELKAQLFEDIAGTKWSMAGGAKASVDLTKKQLEVAGVISFENKHGVFPVELKIEPVLFTWGPDGPKGPALKATLEATPKTVDVQAGGKTWKVALKPAFEAELELDSKAILQLLIEKVIAIGIAETAMIANGALLLFMYFDTIIAVADINEIAAEAKAATAKARALLDGYVGGLTGGGGGGEGGAEAAAALAKLRADVPGVPDELIQSMVAAKLPAGEIRKKVWKGMRAALIAKCMEEYRSRHRVESAFHDFGEGVGEMLGDKKKPVTDVPSSTYGQDILASKLERGLPDTI